MKSRFYIKSICVVLSLCIFIWFLSLLFNPTQIPVHPLQAKPKTIGGFIAAEPTNSISFWGVSQADKQQHRFEVVRLLYQNIATRNWIPTYNYYIVYYGMDGEPYIIDTIIGHTPTIDKKGDLVRIEFIAGAHTHVYKTYKLMGSTAELIDEGNINSLNDKESHFNYFPLAVGNVWEYKNMNTAESHVVRKILSNDPESGRYYLEDILYFGSGKSITIDVIVLDKEKYLRKVASKKPYESQVTELYPADIILKYPLNIGTTWEIEGDDRSDFKVLGFQDITVQAGYFSNVCKILETVMAMDFSLQKRTKYTELVHYYAPNVGLIKTDFVIENGEVNPYIELVSYTVQ